MMPRRVLMFGISFMAAVVVGRYFVFPGTNLSLFWPASGVLAWWALVARSRLELTIMSVLVVGVTFSAYLSFGFSPPAAVLIVVASLATPWGVRLGSQLFERRQRPGEAREASGAGPCIARLHNPLDAYRLFAAGFFAVSLSTVFGTLAMHADGLRPGLDDVLIWFFRNLASVALVTGCGLAISTYRSVRAWPPVQEIALLFGVTLAVGGVVFVLVPQLSIAYAMLLPLAWGAIRVPTPLAATLAVVVSLATVATVLGRDGEAFALREHSVELATTVQLFVVLCCGLAIIVSTALNERAELIDDLTSSSAHASRLFDDAPQGIAETTPSGRIIHGNEALAAKLGCTRQELVGRQFESFSAGHEADFRRHLAEAVERAPQRVTSDWCLVEADGEERHLVLTSRLLPAPHGAEDTVLINVLDVSERRRFEMQLEHMATHDVLTGLANRRRFDDELAAHARRHRQEGHDGALIILDLDHFKEVNDTLGHGAGDELLSAIGLLLRESLRSTDLVARLGGDEFAAILPGADQEAAQAVATSLVQQVRNYTSSLEGAGRHVTASAGVVTFGSAATLQTDPLVLADMLMYDAKESSRDSVAVLDAAANQQPRMGARLAWRRRLEDALDRGDFVLHLQPVLDLRSDRIIGAEALVRLADQEELVLPGEFVGVLESTGLAPRLDAWVVRHGVELLARLQRIEPGFSLALNISGQSMGDTDIQETILGAVREHGVDARALLLEMTETAAVADVEAAREFASAVGATGARFALDDFGAGFCSFYYLKNLRFDVVKIDGEFIVNIDTSAVDQAIVRSIVGGVHDLGKKVIAEFVGSPEVLEEVRRQGVDYAQGYGIGRPLAVEEFVERHLGARSMA